MMNLVCAEPPARKKRVDRLRPRDAAEGGVGASLRGQQREDFVAQLLVLGGRVAHEAVAVSGRALERVVEDPRDLTPAFRRHGDVPPVSTVQFPELLKRARVTSYIPWLTTDYSDSPVTADDEDASAPSNASPPARMNAARAS